MRRLALILVLLAAPPALAQVEIVEPQLGVFASDPGRAFVPGTAERVEVVVTYGPGERGMGRQTPAPTPERPEDVRPTRIVLTATTTPSWITNVTFLPSELFVKLQPENGTRGVTITVPALLNVSPDAPALLREDFAVTATAEPNGNMAGAAATSAPLKLRATTLGVLNVTAQPMAVIPGGRWTVIEFAVRNDGNSDIVAKLNVTVRPENSQVSFRPRDADVPPGRTLDTLTIPRGETRMVEVRLRTPWTNAEFGPLELEATPIVEGEEGTPARAEVEVRGQSAAPAPGAAWLVGALLLLAGRVSRRV